MSTMMSMESECYINKVVNIWCNLWIWKLLAIELFIAMLGCILTNMYFGMWRLGVVFGVASLIFATIGIELGYFGINNFIKTYASENMLEGESEFLRRCESRYWSKSNLVKYEHLLVG